MPIEYQINEAAKLVIAKGSGEVTGTDVLEHLEKLAADFEKFQQAISRKIDPKGARLSKNINPIGPLTSTAIIMQRKINPSFRRS